jgi:hypothetical protein
MKRWNMLIFLLIAGVFTLGCMSAPVSDSCPVTSTEDLLPAQNISDYTLESLSDNLGSDFYRVLLQNDTALLSEIRHGTLAAYRSVRIGSTMDVLVIEFGDSEGAGTAVSRMQNSVVYPTPSGYDVWTENLERNNLSYSSLRISGITNANGVDFYQEFAFWHVSRYAMMTKLTTANVGQDPHQDMLKFIDEMANLCSP